MVTITPKKKIILQPNEFSKGKVRRAVPIEVVPPAPKPVHWSREMLEEELVKAGGTLRRLEIPREYLGLRGGGSGIPDYIRTHAEKIEAERERGELEKAEGVNKKSSQWSPALPSRAEISQLNRILGLLHSVKREYRPIVFAKMCGFGYRRIARKYHKKVSHTTIKLNYRKGLSQMLQAMAKNRRS